MKSAPKKKKAFELKQKRGSCLVILSIFTALLFAFFYFIYFYAINNLDDHSSKKPKNELNKNVDTALTSSITLSHYSPETIVQQKLLNHPLNRLSSYQKSYLSLEDHLEFIHNQTECKDLPIFTSMANVFSDLYWQL